MNKKRIKDLEVYDVILRLGQEFVVVKKTEKVLKLRCGQKYTHTVGAKSHEWVEVIGRQGNPKVIQMDEHGNVLYEYDSIRQASVMTGLRYSSISNCIQKRQRTCGFYKWKRA